MITSPMLTLVIFVLFGTSSFAQTQTSSTRATATTLATNSTVMTSTTVATAIPITTTLPTSTVMASTSTTSSAVPVTTPVPTSTSIISTATCEPSCRVNLVFAQRFLQTANNVASLFTAIVATSGVGTSSRVALNSIHADTYGIPFGNGTLITVTISSFPASACNNFTNAAGCTALTNQSNAPFIAAGLAALGVTNGTRIAANAAIPTFGLLGTVSAVYLALYISSGLGYLVFLAFSLYKYLIAVQLLANERAREEADQVGLSVEELDELKKQEEAEKKRQKTAGGRRRPPPPTPVPVVVIAPPTAEQTFATVDADASVQRSLTKIVTRMQQRSSETFQQQSALKAARMQYQARPAVSAAVMSALSSLTLPPSSSGGGDSTAAPTALFDGSSYMNDDMFLIRRGGLVPSNALQQAVSAAAVQPSAGESDAATAPHGVSGKVGVSDRPRDAIDEIL